MPKRDDLVNIKVDKDTADRIDRAQVAMRDRNPGLKVTRSDAVRAMIEAGAEAVIRGDVGSVGVRRES